VEESEWYLLSWVYSSDYRAAVGETKQDQIEKLGKFNWYKKTLLEKDPLSKKRLQERRKGPSHDKEEM
jgi:hypothetical protein